MICSPASVHETQTEKQFYISAYSASFHWDKAGCALSWCSVITVCHVHVPYARHEFEFKLNLTWKNLHGDWSHIPVKRIDTVWLQGPDFCKKQTLLDPTIGAIISFFAFIDTRVATVRTYFSVPSESHEWRTRPDKRDGHWLLYYQISLPASKLWCWQQNFGYFWYRLNLVRTAVCVAQFMPTWRAQAQTCVWITPGSL
jgi:hypothetical protein